VPGPDTNLPKVINETTYTVDKKPEVLYIGGDFCPYCGVTRWGLVLALMRFGNFSTLNYMESSSTDIYPNTATFTFTNSSYNSNLIHFDGFEVYNRTEGNVTNPGFTQPYQFVYGKYSSDGIPFIDFANDSIQSGASVSPEILHGSNWNQIIANLTNPSSPDAQSIIGNANIFTAYICKSNQTLNMTATACKQSYVKAIIG
jgi:hypothetical protein